jgi:hypothetical protein
LVGGPEIGLVGLRNAQNLPQKKGTVSARNQLAEA